MRAGVNQDVAHAQPRRLATLPPTVRGPAQEGARAGGVSVPNHPAVSPEGAGSAAGPAPYSGARKARAGFPLPEKLLSDLWRSLRGPSEAALGQWTGTAGEARGQHGEPGAQSGGRDQTGLCPPSASRQRACLGIRAEGTACGPRAGRWRRCVQLTVAKKSHNRQKILSPASRRIRDARGRHSLQARSYFGKRTRSARS